MTAIFLVAVGCCVLAWGTLYKCSLYKSQAIQRQTPEAKLCTRASESAKQSVDSTVSGESAVVVQFLDPQLTLSEPLPVHTVRQEEPPPAVIPLRKIPSLFFRPPPSLISASA
jgi:hypothetical protein